MSGANATQLIQLQETRQLKFPPEVVYRAFTDSAKLAEWFGPQGADISVVIANVREGGAYRFTFRMVNGKHTTLCGHYLEVVPNQRLVFTWQWAFKPDNPPTVVSVECLQSETGTCLNITHACFMTEASRDKHTWGWNSTLECLTQFLLDSKEV